MILTSATAAAPKGPHAKRQAGKKRRRSAAFTGSQSHDFHDLCIEMSPAITTVQHVQETTRRLGQLGYASVAFNETVVGRDGVRGLDRPGLKKARNTLWLAAQGGPKENGPVTRLRRVTIIVSDKGEAQFLCGVIRSLKWADLVAARPTSDSALQLLCEAGDVDIISLDLSIRQGFILSTHLADVARARGIVFEVRYAGLILAECATKRQQIMANVSGLLAATRGRGIVWCSGANAGVAGECLRGAYDVMNLAVVLGLKEEQALRAMTATCEGVRGHAKARRMEWIPAEVIRTWKSEGREEEEGEGERMVVMGEGGEG